MLKAPFPLCRAGLNIVIRVMSVTVSIIDIFDDADTGSPGFLRITAKDRLCCLKYGSTLVSSNRVTLGRAQVVFGWVIICKQLNHICRSSEYQ